MKWLWSASAVTQLPRAGGSSWFRDRAFFERDGLRFLNLLIFLWIAVLTTGTNWAGGSGFNVIVVVNQNRTNSLQLGNDYCEARGIPPQNVFRMTNWTGGAITWSRTDFESRLLQPLLAMLAQRGLTNQADFVLLSMDIPYRVVEGTSQNSTTSALYYGFKTNTASPVPGYPTCSLPDSSSNSYVFSERPFREARPNTAATNSFLAMMLTDTNLTGAEFILSRGVASDGSFPTQTVVLAKTSDTARSVRHVAFDNALLDAHVRGDNSLVRLDTSSTSFTNLLGLMTGLATLQLPTNAFVAGTMGDSLTSFGGYVLENNSQTSLLAFLRAGAAASYGTVVEPCNYTEKFPDPMDYFYQHRGFAVAEAYYQSVQNPYQGLLVGEPLAAPFARRGSADWSSLTNGSMLVGQAALDLTLLSAAPELPLDQVDIFLDGGFLETVTNLPPTAGNLLSVTVNGQTIDYPVASNATRATTTIGLANALNEQANSTRVRAYPVGDRIILLSLEVTNCGGNLPLSTVTTTGSAAELTTTLTPARPTFLDSAATGKMSLLVSNQPAAGDWLQLDFIKTNGAVVTVSVTNTTGNTNIGTFVQSLVNRVNTTPALTSADGVSASEFYAYTSIVAAQFTLFARAAGWPAAQIQVKLTGSANLLTLPAVTNRLEDNLSDLQSRNHLYVGSGVTSLPVNLVLNTIQLADGFHELSAVAYEGTSVRTQTRVSRTIQIQNTALAATLTPLLAGTNATLEMPLTFSVTANAAELARIQLFSTGGAVGVISNQSSVLFSVPPASLGLGLHPFYAVATDAFGNRYRTATAWVRIIPSLRLNLSGPPLTLSWEAIPGCRYDVLATTNLAFPFQVVDSILATNAIAAWPVSASDATAGFYRVLLVP